VAAVGEQLGFAGMPERLFVCTPSKLGAYTDCPRRYRYGYVDRPAPPKGPPWAHNSLGASVHTALKNWYATSADRRDPAILPGLEPTQPMRVDVPGFRLLGREIMREATSDAAFPAARRDQQLCRTPRVRCCWLHSTTVVPDDISRITVDITELLPTIISRVAPAGDLQLYVLELAPSTDTRVVDLPEAQPIVKQALELRAAYRVPFWEAVLLLSRRGNEIVTEKILDSAIFHQPMDNAKQTINISAKELTTRKLADLSRRLSERQALVVSSKVVTQDRAGHIPMIDFRIRPSAENERLAASILKRIGHRGTLLNSGNSFHFYGHDLLSGYEQLVRFLGRASLFAPFVDQRWIAHQLIEGSCALRVSPGKVLGTPPTVVAEINS
jgi:hypothetical protein